MDQDTAPCCDHIVHDIDQVVPLAVVIPTPDIEEKRADTFWEPWSRSALLEHCDNQANAMSTQAIVPLGIGMDKGADVKTAASREFLDNGRWLGLVFVVSCLLYTSPSPRD